MLLLVDTTMIPLNWKTITQPFGVPHALNQQSRKGVTVLAAMIDPDRRDKLD